MSTRVIRRMSLGKASVVVFVVVAILTTLFMLKMSQGEALPGSPTDGSAVPHYFGPNPNWALSPTTLSDAPVTINGNGTGATAVATVGALGAITGITITDPGSGYSSASVVIGGSGTLAAATAVVTNSGAVTAITVVNQGSGYQKPTVAISGGGATTQATATAYGGVNAITLANAGTGYTFPTIDFDMPDDPNGTQATAHATFDTGTGAITAILVDNPGSGYATAPNVIVRDGTVLDPINNGGAGASATATLKILSVGLDTFGAGYTSAPTVTISDALGNGGGATAAAAVDNGVVSAINVTTPGSGYITGGGIEKFKDNLPGLCNPVTGCPTAAGAKYIPLAVPENKKYNGIASDEYEIGLVQYRTKFSSNLPATLVRGYVQLETPSWLAAHPGVSQHFPLVNEKLNGTSTPVLIGGVQAYAVTPPQWLGPTIVATKNKAVRVVFHNLLPTGSDGDLFLPVDTTLMGSGMGPMAMPAPVDNKSVMDEVRNPVCTEYPKAPGCFTDNRATLHLHGGTTPWISDGTPHQWITPANETTAWPQGVSVRDVPDMTPKDVPNDGVQTFYYTNQQSARLMFYHDHAWGITRLNVYAGEAAGYLISDNTEKKLITNGTIPGAADTIPLVVQDRTFVPADAQMFNQPASGNVTSYGQDPTWDKTRWGGLGSLWYHHVYMPAQNPGDPSGMSAYGRWMYGPWFFPPAADTKYGPIDNPYYDPNCDLNTPSTWTYQTDPFCEPQQIPGTPNISVGMEQFNDTPIVNGVAYPKVTLQPKSYRLRMLNAANDRFFNFQWYVADPRTGTLSEVALNQSQLDAAQTDPTVFPTPDTAISAAGPDWIQIGSEGGFLPAPTVVNGHQPTTWITDPTRFDFGNVDKHSLVLAPAERADVIVDFSQYAGKTLILYNDAPAAYPARIPSYDYYTGAPDMSPNGAASILPGYGPNTRTIMQVTIAGTPAPAFNLTALRTAFGHKADGSGVFESGQHPIIVGQSAYNSAYGTSFSSGSNCNAIGGTLEICDGLVRVNDTMTFGFNTLKAPTTKTTMPLQPKAIHDEMNATTFDEFGRMQANLGVEAQPPTPGLQNVTLYPFVNPATELIDGTNLPKNVVTYDVNGEPAGDIKITPMSDATDGTQIWRITHNGVDTHPIHFHMYDVQLINRVTWDNIIIPAEPSELGWKDTVRISPLEDTIVALRPIVPQVPWEVPNSIRNLNPSMPTGSTAMFNNIDPQGNPTAAITNQLVNFGWEYVYHCHILSHEEMDMMRPVSLALPPIKPDGLTNTLTGTGTSRRAVLTWNDNSITETAFLVQRSTNLGSTWTTVTTINSPLNLPNIHQSRTYTDPSSFNPTTTVRYYRIVAQNKVGYGAEFPTMTVQSVSASRVVGPSFNITASAGANGSITPTGVITVGRGGSQTFTIAPNANYRILDVLVDGVSNPAAVSSGTFTFSNVLAAHTISATFSASAATITATSGANGSVTPPGVQTVATGGNQTYTITPNAGYHRATVLVDGVDNAGAVTSGTYTFTNVLANHTISATFASNAPPTITVTAPTGTGSYAQGSSVTVNWTASPTVSTGEFGVWAVDSVGGWYGGDLVPANGASGNYTHNLTLSVPIGSGYSVAVMYRPTVGSGAWIFPVAYSPGTFAVTIPYPSVTITAPTGTPGSYAQGSSVTVNWTASPTVSTGEFGVWAVDSGGGWYGGDLVPANGASGNYTHNLTLSVPIGSGYSVAVMYRPTVGFGAWIFPVAYSPGTFAVTIPYPSVTITAPTGTSGSYARGNPVTVDWTASPAVATGEFGVWAVDSLGRWYGGDLVPANGASGNYTHNLTLSVPIGSGYSVAVMYRPTVGSGAWIFPVAYSPGTFAVN